MFDSNPARCLPPGYTSHQLDVTGLRSVFGNTLGGISNALNCIIRINEMSGIPFQFIVAGGSLLAVDKEVDNGDIDIFLVPLEEQPVLTDLIKMQTTMLASNLIRGIGIFNSRIATQTYDYLNPNRSSNYPSTGGLIATWRLPIGERTLNFILREDMFLTALPPSRRISYEVLLRKAKQLIDTFDLSCTKIAMIGASGVAIRHPEYTQTVRDLLVTGESTGVRKLKYEERLRPLGYSFEWELE